LAISGISLLFMVPPRFFFRGFCSVRSNMCRFQLPASKRWLPSSCISLETVALANGDDCLCDGRSRSSACLDRPRGLESSDQSDSRGAREKKSLAFL
jgi:hypothetical protein